MFSDTAIQLKPVFAQWVQNIHTVAPGTTTPNALATASYAFGGDVVAVGNKSCNDANRSWYSRFHGTPYSCFHYSRDCIDSS